MENLKFVQRQAKDFLQQIIYIPNVLFCLEAKVLGMFIFEGV